jgi:predicted esterase
MRHLSGEALRMRYRSALVALAGFLSAGPAVAAPAPNEAFSCERDAGAGDVVAVTTTLAGVPAVVRIPKAVTKPPIVLWHGFGPPASEGALMAALPLDDVPAVKVYLGLPLFGARAPSAGEESVGQRQARDYALRLFEPAVLGAANELAAVTKALEQKHCLRPNDKVALFGFSAGGAAVLSALAERQVLLRAAVTVNAPTGLRDSIAALERAAKRPYAWTPPSLRLADRADAARHAAEISRGNPPPALLLFHGADDTVITAQGAVALEAVLRPIYERAGNGGRLKLVIAPGVSHDWSEPRTLEGLRAAVAEWFNGPGR